MVRLNFNDSHHQALHGSDYNGKVYIYSLSGQKLGEVVINNTNSYQADIAIAAGQQGVRLYAKTLNDNVYEGNESLVIKAKALGEQGWVGRRLWDPGNCVSSAL